MVFCFSWNIWAWSPGGERHPLAAAAPLMWVLPPHPSLGWSAIYMIYGDVRTSKVLKLHWSTMPCKSRPETALNRSAPSPDRNPEKSHQIVKPRLLISMQCTIGMAHPTHGLTEISGGQPEPGGGDWWLTFAPSYAFIQVNDDMQQAERWTSTKELPNN